jgi:hypothetical protein
MAWYELADLADLSVRPGPSANAGEQIFLRRNHWFELPLTEQL